MLRFKYAVGRQLFEILRNIRAQHGGDFEEYLILFSLLLASDYHQMSMRRGVAEKPLLHRPHGINLLSISEITGIPRETVRRKVGKLVTEGSITRGDDGLHYYSGNSEQDDITARILEGLPNAHDALSTYLPPTALLATGKAIGK